MNKRTISACLTALAATNCASLPAPPENDGISVDLLVDAVQCELASVYENNRQFSSAVRDWVVNVTLTLKVTDETESRPTVTITPVISPGTLTLVVGPDFNDQSQRIAEIQFDVHMRDLDPKKRSKSRNRLPPCIGNTGLPQAENSLGLGRWMSTIATAAGRPDFATLTGGNYNLEFTVERGLHGGLTYKSAHIEVDATGAKASKTVNNHLVASFTEDKNPTVVAGKSRTSTEASERIQLQRLRFLPQRLILQSGTGRLTQ